MGGGIRSRAIVEQRAAGRERQFLILDERENENGDSIIHCLASVHAEHYRREAS